MWLETEPSCYPKTSEPIIRVLLSRNLDDSQISPDANPSRQFGPFDFVLMRDSKLVGYVEQRKYPFMQEETVIAELKSDLWWIGEYGHEHLDICIG